ncbi:DUF2490 domain-containing protein [Adhaeribacter soli]|uniref:DUF2490 domain-containing protein n=1 Tax=Adhaeribacter soli TaxID=2607655 RepID=A0A5N1IX19_9BACT|nr:DUF2490 domain-containing protein [Adhaeribacter soli]KAA9338834.1 DUF2490 domain-containing protein [Adhaeribacter soli]
MFSLFLSLQVFAQAPLEPSEKNIHNQQNWFTYFGQYKLGEKWGIHADVQFRMDEDVKFAKQNLLRAGLIRYLNPQLNLTAGYAYINSHNAGLNAYATEHRIWEQVIFNHRPANLNMTHRLRLEHRFVEQLRLHMDGSVSPGSTKYGNRIRYFNRTILDLTRKPEAKNVVYFALQDEIFLNVAAPALNSNVFDQNRFLAAVGVFHDKKTRLELGYMNQFLTPYRQANAMNHILHVSVLQTLDFSGNKPKTPVQETIN